MSSGEGSGSRTAGACPVAGLGAFDFVVAGRLPDALAVSWFTELSEDIAHADVMVKFCGVSLDFRDEFRPFVGGFRSGGYGQSDFFCDAGGRSSCRRCDCYVNRVWLVVARIVCLREAHRSGVGMGGVVAGALDAQWGWGIRRGFEVTVAAVHSFGFSGARRRWDRGRGRRGNGGDRRIRRGLGGAFI